MLVSKRASRAAIKDVCPRGREDASKPRRALLVWSLAMAGCASRPAHGKLSTLSLASDRNWKACQHQVPESVCVRCHPELAGKFKQRGDWCPEHDVAESQCLLCQPDLDFSPPEAPPANADVLQLVEEGGSLAALEPHLVAGKITIFDFHAAWCMPCRTVDRHLYGLLRTRSDIAIRKIDVGSWDSPVAEQWLGQVPELPHLIIFDKKGKQRAALSGAKLEQLDRALAEASR